MARIEVEAQAQAQTQTSSSCNKYTVIAKLISRFLTFILLLVALILLAVNTVTLADGTHNFTEIMAYQYMMAATVIGFAYNLVQTGFALYQVSTGRPPFKGNSMLYFDFFADKAISILLGTGAAAGFGVGIDIKAKRIFPYLDDFLDKGTATGALVFVAFFFNEASQIISSFALPKRNC